MEQHTRRLRLRVAAKLMLALAFFGILYVLLAMMFSGNPDTRVVPTKVVDIGNMRAGELRMELWEGRPVLIYRRTLAQVESLQAPDARLLDAQSSDSKQPEWARNALRSSGAEFFISIGVGTDFSCPVGLLAASSEIFMDKPWSGGFVDQCRGARYDFAGRVYKGQYADENLWIPDYRIKADVLILGG